MNDRERADWLARAIDDLVLGRGPSPTPAGMDPAETDALMRVARMRLDAGRDFAHRGLQYEGAVWQQVRSRLEQRAETECAVHNDATNPITDAGDFAVFDDPEDDEVADLKDIVALRRHMASSMLAFAERHRTEVWRQVRSRIQAGPNEQSAGRRRGIFAFLRPASPTSDGFSLVLDRIAAGQRVGHSGDPQIDGLIRIAQERKELSRMNAPSAEREDRVWARISPTLSARIFGGAIVRPETTPRRREQSMAWPRLAVAAAAAALIVAAIGPIPATGLADAPAAQFVRFISDHIGVRETPTQPPVAPSNPAVVAGTDTRVADAAGRLGLPLDEPTVIPPGMSQTSSRYYLQAMTATEGGMFVLSYQTAAGETLVVYQERAGGSEIAALGGTAEDVALSDGTPATFVQGSWQAASGGFTWSDASSETLVFERNGVRTVIVLRGPVASSDPTVLLATANSMTPAAASR